MRANNQFTRHLKLLFLLSKTYWQRHIIYRFSAVIWIINGMITPLVLMGVWLTIRQNNQLPLDDKQIVTYYILSILVLRLTQSWRAEGLGRLINRGDFSIYLLRPFSFFTQELSRDLSLKLIRLISLVPFLMLITFIFREKIIFFYKAENVFLFIVTSILGFVINFLLEMTIGFLAFWLEHAEGASLALGIVTGLFNGTLIPLALMPQILRKLMIALPFRYIVSFPIEVLMGSINSLQLTQGFLILSIWILLLKSLLNYTYSKGVKRYTAVGT